jgi:AcrR family transcriptional regulator
VIEATAGRAYRGLTAQDRLADRRRRLLDAGVELFGTNGVAATTVSDVCDHAGLIKRYFYESFDNLDALLDAVVADVLQAVTELVLTTASAHAKARDQARAALGAFVDYIAANPAAGRLIMRETMHPGGALAARRQEFLERAIDVIRQFVDEHARRRPASAVDARLTSLALAGASGEVLLGWLDGRVDANRDQILDHLAALYELAASIRVS